MRSILAAAALLTAAPPAAAVPAAWTVVPARSRVGFSGTYAGNGFTGSVGQFAAAIRFDPADLPGSKVNVVVATASVKTGDSFRDTTLAGGEWFDPAHFPRATFATTRIAAAGAGRYVADGVLTLKGKAVPVRLPFALRIAGDTATMQGSVALDRIALGLGAKSDPGGAWVSRPIALTIALVAVRAR